MHDGKPEQRGESRRARPPEIPKDPTPKPQDRMERTPEALGSSRAPESSPFDGLRCQVHVPLDFSHQHFDLENGSKGTMPVLISEWRRVGIQKEPL